MDCSSYSYHTAFLLNTEIFFVFKRERMGRLRGWRGLHLELIQQPVNHSFQICVRLLWFIEEVGQGRIHGNETKKKDTAIWSMPKCTNSLSHALTIRQTNSGTLFTHLEGLAQCEKRIT